MKKLLELLKGRKTYLVVAIGVILNGLFAMGYIDADKLPLINSILTMLGLGTIRLGLHNK